MNNILRDRSGLRLKRQNLDVITTCLGRIGFSPESSPKFKINMRQIVLVAGTNGKGSVCAALENFLRNQGFRTGLFTSPHLMCYNERIQLNGAAIGDELMLKSFNFIYPKVVDLEPSYFEILVLLAVDLFFSEKFCPAVDWAIFEVGLGGRFDATNAVPHGTSVITRLGLDHIEFLGPGLENIAENKLGIVDQPHRHLLDEPPLVIHFPPPQEARAAFSQTEKKCGGIWKESLLFETTSTPGAIGPDFWINTPWGKFRNALAGPRGGDNASIALSTLQALGFDSLKILESFSSIRWPGRMECFRPMASGPEIYLSGDHNPQGIRSLLELLPFYPRADLHLVVGMSLNKDIDSMMSDLLELKPKSLHITSLRRELAEMNRYEKWKDQISGYYENVESAFAASLNLAKPDDMVLVTGSLYLVGAIRQLLNNG